MPTVTLAVPRELKKEMDSLPEFNWSYICRERIREQIAEYKLFKSITDKSKLSQKDALEIADRVKEGMYKEYKKRSKGVI